MGALSNNNNYRSTTRINPFPIDILFLIYINDWQNCLSFWPPRMCVDDTHITYAPVAQTCTHYSLVTSTNGFSATNLALIYSEYDYTKFVVGHQYILSGDCGLALALAPAQGPQFRWEPGFAIIASQLIYINA